MFRRDFFEKSMVFALALMGFMACNDGDSPEKKVGGSGYLSLEIAQAESVENVTRAQITIGEAANDYTTPAAKDFTINITNEEEGYAWSGTIGEWDATTALAEGSYSVSASYDNGSVGFNKPRFAGSTTFTIIGGETKVVSIPVKLKNALVRLSFSEMFKNYYSFEKFVVSSNGSNIDFTADQSNAAFIETGEFTITTTLTSQAGVETTKTFTYTAKEAQCYTIAFDASNIGGNSFTITFGDEPTETVDFGDIDINE